MESTALSVFIQSVLSLTGTSIVGGIIGNTADRFVLRMKDRLTGSSQERDLVYSRLFKIIDQTFLFAIKEAVNNSLLRLTGGKTYRGVKDCNPENREDVIWLERCLKNIDFQLAELEGDTDTYRSSRFVEDINYFFSSDINVNNGLLQIKKTEFVERIFSNLDRVPDCFRREIESNFIGRVHTLFEQSVVEDQEVYRVLETRYLSNIREKISHIDETIIDQLYEIKKDITDIKSRGSIQLTFDLNELREPFIDYAQAAKDNFVGRAHVYKVFDDFVDNKSCGYFTITAYPGVGKTAFSAYYALERNTDCLYYFNIGGRVDKANVFLSNICQQIISRYDLEESISEDYFTNGDFLVGLLDRVSSSYLVPNKEKLIIVVDALDEVDWKNEGPKVNKLYLPHSLPQNVYFLLTQRMTEHEDIRRPEPRNLEDRGSHFLAEENSEYLRLDSDRYKQNNLDDIREFVEQSFERPLGKNILLRLSNQEILDKDKALKKSEFIDKLVEVSDGNFMYVRCILSEFNKGTYSDFSSNVFLNFSSSERSLSRLERYYADHWRRMGDRDIKTLIVYIIAYYGVPPSVIEIMQASEGYGNITLKAIDSVLNDWFQFLKRTFERPKGYYFYHRSYRDFVAEQDEVKEIGMTMREFYGMMRSSVTDSDLDGLELARE